MAIVVLLAGYISLAYLLHIESIFAGSLFLFFWVGVEKAAPAAFVATLVGAIGGIANASLLHASVATALAIDPSLAALAGLGVLMLAVYMLLIHKARWLFNQSYMLFVAVGAIPQLSDAGISVSMVEGVSLSAAYFGSIVWILHHIGTRRPAEAIMTDRKYHDDVLR
jgi:hypothetical protein